MALIVDMKMPMNCCECPMRRNYAIQDKERGTTYCAILNLSNGGFTDRRPRWCPILQKIPDHHGRLVDADKFDPKYITFRKTPDGFEKATYGAPAAVEAPP